MVKKKITTQPCTPPPPPPPPLHPHATPPSPCHPSSPSLTTPPSPTDPPPSPSVCSSSSPPLPFHERFVDIPRPLRERLVRVCEAVMRQSLRAAAEQIRGLSLRKRQFAGEYQRLIAELETARLMGFDVEEYRSRLDDLHGISETWEQFVGQAARRRREKRRIREELAAMEERERGEYVKMHACYDDFKRVALAPWQRKPPEEAS